MNPRVLIIGLVCSLTVESTGFSQKSTKEQKPASSPRALTIADADDWKSVRQFTLSPDGKWAAHSIMPNEGDGTLTVAKTDSTADTENHNESATGDSNSESEKDQKDKGPMPSDHYQYVVGPGSGQITFSHDSKFAAWIQAAAYKAAKAAKSPDASPKNKVVLLNLETGQTKEFDKAQSFRFSGENPKCLAIHKMKPKGRPSGDGGWDGTDLLIHDLQSDSQINIGNVKSFSFNKSGDHLAMVIDAEGKSGNGLQLFHVNDSRIEILDSSKSTYGSMAWTREGDALALLKANKDDEFENDRRHLLAFSNVGSAKQQKMLLDPVLDPGIPESMTISSNRTPQWNEERTAVFFGIEELKKKDDKKSGEQNGGPSDKDGDAKKGPAQSADEKDAGLVIWHWQDPRLQSMQQKQESSDKRRSDLCVHQVESATTIRLADEEIPRVSVSRPYKFAVGRDNRKHELSGNLDGRRLQDIYTIDLESGKRKLALEAARYVFDVGPDGISLLYYKNEGHFYVYNMRDGTHTNITENAEVSFIDTEDDHNITNPPRRPVGWTADSKHVLLSDGWDVWKVSIDGKSSENLTVNGKAEQIRYTNPHRFDPDIDGIDMSAPVYFSAYGEWTKQAGFARLMPGKTGVEMLVWEDASFGRLSKLEDEPVYMYSKSTNQDPTSYYVAGPDLNDSVRHTDLTAEREKFKWSDGVKLIDYTNSQGVRLQGALHLPAGYIEGKKYPTIVYMYEKLSQTANRFDSPRTGGFSASIYTSNGYAVFNPDIVFEINDPGMSSKDCILAGLDAAIESGVVDPEKVGLHGHSWGGYQTAFLITQTDRFKAAVSGAPLTNMISMYSSIYWNSGSANQPIFESSQGRFKGGYWDNLDAYARNSPVYFAEQVTTPLLLLHNDEDGAVDWNQGIEYFNTLRRLGKPVVMLQYVGENHGLRKPENRKDYSYRMLDFFNHYLKADKAPQWWTDGIKHLDMKEHVKDYRKQKTSPSSN
ncbi:MAG TPA: S9 family peptidase [Planctomycetaceae bacterium]|nr:S9 family peptidase [Planctomycetaceae bacterium]